MEVCMNSYTANKVGGLCLIIGPALATLMYILSTFVFSTGAGIDPSDFQGLANAGASAPAYERLLILLIPLALFCALNGFAVLQSICKADGNGDGLTRLGLILSATNFLGIFIAVGATQAAAWVGPNADLVAMTNAITTVGGFIGSIGIALFALGISTRQEFNKMLSLIVAALFAISAIVTLVAITDTSLWQMAGAYFGLTYIVISAWSIHLGLVIRNQS
jgi:hypothetical protein